MNTYFCKAIMVKKDNGYKESYITWLSAKSKSKAKDKIKELYPDAIEYQIELSNEDYLKQYNKSGNWTGD